MIIWTRDLVGNHHVSVVSKVDWSIGCVVGLFFCVQCTGAVVKALAIDHNSVGPSRDQPGSKLCDNNINRANTFGFRWFDFGEGIMKSEIQLLYKRVVELRVSERVQFGSMVRL